MSPDNRIRFGNPNNLGGSSGWRRSRSRPTAAHSTILEGRVIGDDTLDRRVYGSTSRTAATLAALGPTACHRPAFVSDAVAFGRDELIVASATTARARPRDKEGIIIEVPRPSPEPRQARDRRPARRQGTRTAPGCSARPVDFGLGNPSSSLTRPSRRCCRSSGKELAFVNDTNFGSTGRNAGLAGLQRLHRRQAQVIVGVSRRSVSPRKNARARDCQTNIMTTPSASVPTPSTNTVPRPKIEPPLPYSGSAVSIASLMKTPPA